VTGFCKHGNYLVVSTKDGELLDQLSYFNTDPPFLNISYCDIMKWNGLLVPVMLSFLLQTLLPLNDAEAVQAKFLKESRKEEGTIQAQLQIMKLERDKFEMLVASKDKELEKLKQEAR
jgi:hypothetical protein